MKLNFLAKIHLRYLIKFLSEIRGAEPIINIMRKFMEESRTEETLKKHVFHLYQMSKSKNRLSFVLSNHLLGFCYIEGVCVTKDHRKAFVFYKKAADMGYPPSQCTVGCMYQNGFGVNQDVKVAHEYYRKSARQGWALAHYRIGTCYEDGIGIKKDQKMAFKFYQFSANKGYALAQHNLGVFYGKGRGVDLDEKRAFELFQSAFANGWADSRINISHSYMLGRGVNKNPIRAMEMLFTMAAEQQSREEILGKVYLGFEYHSGQEIKKNHERAVLLLQHVETNKENIINEPEYDHLQDKIKEIKDSIASTPHLNNAIECYMEQSKIDSSRFSMLGFCYMMGLGTGQDLIKAEEYFKLGIDNGHPCLWDLYYCYIIMSQTKLNNCRLESFCKDLGSTEYSNNQLEYERQKLLFCLYRYGSIALEQNLFKAEKYQPDNRKKHPQGESLEMLFQFNKVVKDACDSVKLIPQDVASIISEYAFDFSKTSSESQITRLKSWFLPPF